MVFYLDTSAFVKLVVSEEHSHALVEWVRESRPVLIASDLMAVEAQRTARRHSVEAVAATRERLGLVTLLRVSLEVCARAAEAEPPTVRTLDALHLATALQLDEELQGVITYDAQMIEAAQTLGLRVLTPTSPR